MVGDLRMWLYRAHPGNPRRCAGADHCSPSIGQSRSSHGSILSSPYKHVYYAGSILPQAIKHSWLLSLIPQVLRTFE